MGAKFPRQEELKEVLMKSAILEMLVLALLPCLAQAQSSGYSKGQGYVYVAPGRHIGQGWWSRMTVEIGGGGEGFLTRRFGLGADVGYVGNLAPDEKFFHGWGTPSINFVARFPRKGNNTRAEGFVTAGYTRVIAVTERDGNGVNFGFGFNWWLEKRAALRIEVRDHIYSLFRQDALGHIVGLRIGVAFR
jgi:hypothetical protein